MASASAIAAGVLAGGEGRRHGGADKGWLPFHGRPLIEHVLGSLQPQSDELLVSANRNVDRYAGLGVRVVRDTLGGGPLAGLRGLMLAARHPWLLCAPCDAPGLPADIAARLMAAAIEQGSDIAVLHDGVRAHPTICLVRVDLVSDAEQYLRGGESSLLRWQQRHDPAWLQGVAPLNLNTPQALADAERMH